MEYGQIKEQLVARAEIRDVDEFQQRGRQRVQIIRADHIADIVDRAIDAAVNDAGLLPRAQAIELIEQTRTDFVETVEAQQSEIESLRAKLAQAREQLAQFGSVMDGATALPEANAPAPAPAAATPPPPAAAPAPAATAAPAPAAADGAADVLANAVDQLSAAMNSRLDQMSKKLGISTAVEAADVNLGALFEHGDGAESAPVESNIDDFQVKKKTSGGIGANLARLKKLKNGGGD